MNITKIFLEHIKLTQELNESIYDIDNKRNNRSITKIISDLKNNSDELGSYLSNESVSQDDQKTSDGMKKIREMKKMWSDAFFGTEKTPGHIRLAGRYIQLVHSKAEKKKKDEILKLLTNDNLRDILRFWLIMDKMIFKSFNKNVLMHIKKGLEEHLVCTKKYIDTLYLSGFGQRYTKSKVECDNQGKRLAEKIENYLRGDVLIN